MGKGDDYFLDLQLTHEKKRSFFQANSLMFNPYSR